MSDSLHERARSWTYSRLVSTEACAERLRAIKNDAVNEDAQRATLGSMREEIEVLSYLHELLGPPSSATEKSE